jgi:hypothetical protein
MRREQKFRTSLDVVFLEHASMCTLNTLKDRGTTIKITEEQRANLWSNHVNYLAQYIFKKHRLLSHAFHPMQLLLIKELHLIPCQNFISIQIYALEPKKKSNIMTHEQLINKPKHSFEKTYVAKYIQTNTQGKQ